ncbi:copper chaperone PCu(A)C [Sphingomonas cavernae]|uniref:Copper chaperone PCu(A)C n=1 Tax=Sphingomonas cavernae TaxID=2320861 RepID=A0A418W611_9SPHN|nr:copper chaperone PCu(A)C [Sphingomonas cavernae]RJF85475.1 copper chaperone PCu(A)C [Sphingomonas cavernae]
MRLRLALAPVLAAAALALGSCGQDPVLYVDKGWVRLPAVMTNPGAAYFTVHGGLTDDTLIRVSSDVAIKTEMHDVVTENGVTKMVPLQSVPIPAKGKVEFKAGGKHVMLFDLRRNLKAGETIRLDFTFASGEQIYIDAPLQAAGAPAPGGEEHNAH